MQSHLTRREVLRAGAAAAAGAGLLGLGADPLIEQALAAPARRGRLADIEHVVILMQENRSFDHYFGTLPGVRGFSDHSSAFAQPGFPQPGFNGTLLPFHLNSGDAPQCFPDIVHEWGPQHRSWNGGAMNRFVAEHLADDVNGAGAQTMGYYERQDIPFYFALAKAFTICDRYHCSVIGPTDPNRVMSMSGTLDPDGTGGGPLLRTVIGQFGGPFLGRFTWRTMPEQLSAHGVSWKVYTSPPPAGSGGSVDQRILENGLADNVLPYFKSFETNPKLAARGIKPTYPHDFHDDIAHNRLPSVSWVLPPLRQSEHPGQSSAKAGEFAARQVLAALTAKHKVWSKTALFITWDENGGFFDHVPPPTAPAGTPGEYVTIPNLPSEAQGIRGPIGLGFRVPMIIASPFSRGGFVSSQVFDHTSTLRFLETRFRVRVPNLSKWRRSVTGDLTGAFNFARPDERVPRLPRVSLSPQQQVSAGCGSGLTPGTPPYPAPPNSMPVQRRVRPRRPSGLR